MDTTETPPPTVPPVTATPAIPGVVTLDQIDIEHFAKVKLRVAKIESAEPLPKSKKLLRLQVDLGPELGKRQILSGIAQHYTPEQLVGRSIIVIANLKPAMMMGTESQGMLLAAGNETTISLLQADKEMAPGTVIR
jgi:methionyl-tRNA synthetase